MKKYFICIFVCCFMMIQRPVFGQQVSISRIDQMPFLPKPYVMRNWKSVAKGYDSLVFATDLSGQYLPLNTIYSNTVNYPSFQSFKLRSYVGSPDFGGEGINCLPAVIGAELTGIDKENQNGINWVAMCKEWFNTTSEERIYLNAPRASSGDDWWYETMPNVFFFQLYDLHPDVPEFQEQSRTVADRWLSSVKSMKGSATPWHVPNMDHRSWKFSTMTPYDNDVHEPEASGAISWILYQEYLKTGEQKYRIGAEWSMEFLNSLSVNPSYELQLPYGAYSAARMNAEIGTNYNLLKILTWCFDVGPLRSWGATIGKWGEYDCDGMIGEVNQFDPSYAFLMNTFQQVGTLCPVARYDDRYAAAIGKWILNAANAVRLFYPAFLPDSNQDSRTWSSQYDPNSYIGHEAMKQSMAGKSPFATGDAFPNGWAETNLALYGSSHVGYLASVIDTTNVPMVLKSNLLATDFSHLPAYQTYLYFNPYDSTVSVSIDAGPSNVDLYDAAANVFVKTNVSSHTAIDIPPKTARVIVIVPAAGTITYSNEKMLINDIIVDYHSDHPAGNHTPRIKALAATKDTVLVHLSNEIFCTAVDADGDTLSYQWNASRGLLSGSGSQVLWSAPDSEGNCTITCTVKDSKNAETQDTIHITAVKNINHPPVIYTFRADPRKVNANASSQIFCDASDIDADSLQYTWSSDAGTITGNGSLTTWECPNIEGLYWIRCAVNDGHGGIDLDSVSVEVRDFSQLVKGNILAYYPFNGNANDASGNGRNGMASNGQFVPDRNGVLNSAYLFNGQNSSVTIPNDIGLNVQNAIAINFWMKIGGLYTREQYPLSHGNWEHRWKVSISNDHLRWTVKTSTGTKDLDSESPVLLDSLYNVTVQYAHGMMELYLNNTLDAIAPWSGTIQQTTTDLCFGQSLPNDNNYNFNGILDDIRIVDYELSSDEIAALSSRVMDVNGATSVVPDHYSLSSYPNPFNPTTTIHFSLPVNGYVVLKVYDMLGREIQTVLSENMPAGSYERQWNAGNRSSGVYFCVLKWNNKRITNKLVLMR